jgi:hypothetical protein
MKKLMILVTIFALMLATAVPALAYAVGGGLDATYVDASQTQAATALQVNEGDAEAEAGGLGSAADTSIDQSLSVEQSQVNGGLGGVAAGGDIWSSW